MTWNRSCMHNAHYPVAFNTFWFYCWIISRDQNTELGSETGKQGRQQGCWLGNTGSRCPWQWRSTRYIMSLIPWSGSVLKLLNAGGTAVFSSRGLKKWDWGRWRGWGLKIWNQIWSWLTLRHESPIWVLLMRQSFSEQCLIFFPFSVEIEQPWKRVCFFSGPKILSYPQ